MPWMEMDIKTYWKKVDKGRLSSFDLTRWYLERIARLDSDYNSILEINPDALFIAEARDRELVQGLKRGPLHGLPILLKDNISTDDSLHTTGGSRALKDNFARKDAFIVKRLREAGAVILGKTNLTEMSHFTSSKMKAGYSALGGQTINPYNKKHTTSGSSSGSAVAMAMNFGLLSLGTETKGSIIWPSQANSIVGIKPSRGLVSRSGILPISRTYDTAGPMTRTVADAAYLLSVLAGEDSRDPSTWALDDKRFSYEDFLDEDALKGMRLGLVKNRLDRQARAIFKEARELMERLGASFLELPSLPRIGNKDELILRAEFKRSLEAYLKDYAYDRTLLEEIIDYNRMETSLVYGQDLLEGALNQGHSLKDRDYLQLVTRLPYELRESLEGLMDQHGLDLLVYPGRSELPAISGLPSIIVPGGYLADKRALGISFTARLFDEARMLGAAYSYERASRKRRPPKDRR